MTQREPFKQFCAVSYDNQVYHFIIDKDNKIHCCEFRLGYGADVLELKPNFVLRNQKHETLYSLKDYLRTKPKMPKKKENLKNTLEPLSKEDSLKQQHNLIGYYIIEPEIFEYMIENKMLLYSHDMALLYRLNPEYAYDSYFQTRSFKKQRNNKEKVLIKQKKGIFS